METLRTGPNRPFHLMARESVSLPWRGIGNCGIVTWRVFVDSERVVQIGGRICKKCLKGPTPLVRETTRLRSEQKKQLQNDLMKDLK